MRLGDGTELLGPNDPLGAAISLIYVAPTDDRASVLTAILGQDKLKRKQIAVILPEQNRAFQTPGDFDGLKGLRNQLQAKIVFIAPPGPGPAEFARQRRFDVYSSPESYKVALQDKSHQDAQKGKAGFGFFGRKQSSQATTSAPAPNQRQNQPAPPVIVPMPLVTSTSGTVDDQQQPAPPGTGVQSGSPVAVPAPASVTSPNGGDDDADDNVVNFPLGAPPAGPHIVDSTSPASTSPAPPANRGDVADVSTAPPNAPGAAGPNPLELPRKGNSGKIPVVVPIPAAQPTAQPASSLPNQQRNAGNAAVVMPVGTAAPNVVGPPRTTIGGGPPPPPQGPAGGGRTPRRRRRGWLIIPLVILILLTLGLGIAVAAPNAIPSITGLLPGATPSATVTITPKSSDLKNTYIISAVTGTADPAQRQVQARQLSANVSSQPKTVPATGKVTTKAVAATGTLTFYNGGGVEYDVAANTVFTDAKGVQVANDTLAAIPAGNPATGYGRVTVAAHAVTLGTAGNIAALDFNTVNCCGAPSVFVSNTAPFTGGVDPQNYTAVQQSDVDNVANPQIKSLTDSAQTGLQKQLRPGEKLVSQPNCTSKVDANPAVGTKADTVTVTVTETCTAEAYDQQGALTMATTLLTDKAKTDPGPSYALMGNVVSTISSVTVTDTKGTLSLQVTAEGIWVFQVSDALKQSWAKQIAGKSKQAAINFLAGQSGISKVNGIDLSGGDGNTLPTDPTQITIVVQTVPGLKGTPTSGPGTPGTSGSPTSQPGNGG